MMVAAQSVSKEKISPQPSGVNDRFNLLLLAFFYGSFFLLGTILTYMARGISGQDEFRIFVLGWSTAPVLTWLALLGVYKLKQRKFSDSAAFFPVLLGINTLFSLLAASRLYFFKSAGLSIPLFTRVTIQALILFVLVQLVTLWLLHRFAASPLLSRSAAFYDWAYWFILAGIGAILVSFSGIFANHYPAYIIPAQLLLLAAPFGVLAFLHKYLIRPAPKKALIVVDIAAIILIVGACFDPLFTINAYHENFYLGPINALLHGKTMLVDVYSQYGVFVHEFLAFVFSSRLLPFNYQGMAFLVALLSICQYILIYFLIRTLIKSPIFSLVLLGVVLLLNLFATLEIYQSFPSIGPLRFGLCFLLITITALRFQHPARKSIFVGLEYFVLGIAALWSFETFIYTVTIFLGIRGYEALATTSSLGGFFKKIAFELLKALLVIALFHSIQALAIFLRARTWPQWDYYFGFINAYSVAGLGEKPIDVWSPWFIMVVIYFIGLVSPFSTRMITKEWDTSYETQIILCFVFFGIAQFTYYVGRSEPNNLFHISVPAIIIAGYGASRITTSGDIRYKGARYILLFWVYTATGLVGIIIRPNLINKIPNTGLGFGYAVLKEQWSSNGSGTSVFQETYDRLWHPNPTSSQVATAMIFIEEYAADKPRVLVLLPSLTTTEVLFLSDKAQIYPISEQVQDGLSGQISDLILNYSPDLHRGDVIFLPENPMDLALGTNGVPGENAKYQIILVSKLCALFSFKQVGMSQDGVIAFRLAAHGSDATNYCASVQAMKNQ